jgi:type I restriction enzyme R subunit
MLRGQVAGMSLDTFEVRPHRRTVEQYARTDAFAHIDAEQTSDLHPIARLPTAASGSDTAAKVFDHLLLRMQLAYYDARRCAIRRG